MEEINYNDQIIDAKGMVRGFRAAEKLSPGPDVKYIDPSSDKDPGSLNKEYKINLGGTEICLDDGAKNDWKIMYLNNAAVLIRAGSDYDRVKAAASRAYAEAESWQLPLDQAQLQKEIINEFVGTSTDFPAQQKKESSIEIVLVSTINGRMDKKTRVDTISVGEKHTNIVTVNENGPKLEYGVMDYADYQGKSADAVRNEVATRGDEKAWILVDCVTPQSIDNITGGPARAYDSAADPHQSMDQQTRRELRSSWPVADVPVPGETLMAGIARVIARANSHNIRSDAPMVRRNVPGSTGVVVIK